MAAPEGNDFNRLFKTPEELQEKIDAYFTYCKEEQLHPEICGMAVFLGTNRRTLLNYEKNYGEEFHTIVEDAKAKCEAYAAQLLYRPATVTGVIFNLVNNYNWKDKKDIEVNTKLDALVDAIDNRETESETE